MSRGFVVTAYFTLVVLATAACAQIPSTPGWYEIPNTKINDVCACTHGFDQICGAEGCAGIVNDWNSAVFDTKRNRLVVWGGGHNGYYGNELYAVSLDSLNIRRITDPGLPAASYSSCLEAIANNSQPNSRHTYDGICYAQSTDQLFSWGGAIACGSSGRSKATWIFEFAQMAWSQKTASGTLPGNFPTAGEGAVSAYDPNTQKVYLHDLQYLFAYDPVANSYEQLSGSYTYGIDYHLTAVIDPKRRQFVMMGNNQAWIICIHPDSSHAIRALTTTGGGAIVATVYPGLAYDNARDKIVSWNGGDTVYSLDLDTKSWSAVTYAGGPGKAPAAGTYKRWSYSQKSNLFILVNQTGQNAFTFRFPGSSVAVASGMHQIKALSPEDDFLARRSGPGVIQWVGFDDTTAEIKRNVNSWPDGKGVFRSGMDTVIKASGNGSLRFDLPPPPHAGANIAGQWLPKTNDGLGRLFGQNSTFYVQIRQRFSPDMLDNTWNSSWKTVLFHYNQQSCGSIELTTVNRYMTGLVTMYTDCGARGMTTMLDGHTQTDNTPLLLQQGDYNCQYGRTNTTDCFYFVPNEWLTFYYKIHVGDWDQPNSSVEAWAAREGGVYKKFINVLDFALHCNSDPCTLSPGKDQGYNNITLTPYMTGLSPDSGKPGVTAQVWYDELIVSTQPIPAPGTSSILGQPGGNSFSQRPFISADAFGIVLIKGAPAIRLSLTRLRHVSIRLFTVLGRLDDTPYDGMLDRGEHTIRLGSRTGAAQIRVAEIKIDNEVMAMKMIVPR